MYILSSSNSLPLNPGVEKSLTTGQKRRIYSTIILFFIAVLFAWLTAVAALIGNAQNAYIHKINGGHILDLKIQVSALEKQNAALEQRVRVLESVLNISQNP